MSRNGVRGLRSAGLLATLAAALATCQAAPKEASLGPGGASLVAVLVNPPTAKLNPGQSSDFNAVGVYSDSSIVSGIPVTWSTDGGTVNGAGKYTAGPLGQFGVTATSSGLSGGAEVIVVPPDIVSLQVSPASVSTQPARVTQFSVTARLSDGTTDNAPAVTWQATGGTITQSGRFTAGNTGGNFRVVASADTIADTALVSVTTATITSVTMTPASVALQSGQSQQFTVVATFSDGSTLTNPAGITYTATGGGISSSGRYTAGGVAGSFLAIASANGKADTSTVAITVPTITAITISPANANVPVGQTQPFTVTATLSNGSTQNNPPVTWTATGGTVSNTGLYTAGTVTGTFLVIATCTCGPADTASVVVATSSEPVYQPGVNTLLHADNFDSYSGQPGGPWENTPSGTSMVSPGRGGTGKAARLTYTPSDYYSGIDLRFNQTTRIFVSYSFRILPAGYDVVEGDETGSGMKWFTLWRPSPTPRQTWGANQLGGVQGTTFGTHDNSSNSMPNPVNGASGLWNTVNDGNWHRYTIEAYTGTGTNGYERCWLDGVKIFDTSGRGYDRSTQGFDLLQLGHDKVAPPLGTRTIDIDDFTAWTP